MAACLAASGYEKDDKLNGKKFLYHVISDDILKVREKDNKIQRSVSPFLYKIIQSIDSLHVIHWLEGKAIYSKKFSFD